MKVLGQFLLVLGVLASLVTARYVGRRQWGHRHDTPQGGSESHGTPQGGSESHGTPERSHSHGATSEGSRDSHRPDISRYPNPDSDVGDFIPDDRESRNQHNWCCHVELSPVKRNVRVTVTRVGFQNRTRKIRSGSEPCGYMDWYMCTKYETIWDEVPVTYTDVTTRQQWIKPSCPAEHLVCCAGFVRVNSNCIELEHAQQMNDTYQASLNDELLKQFGG